MVKSDGPVDVFISYSRKNKDVVLHIKDEIERTLGLRCWMDLNNIPSGSDDFVDNVIQGIEQARVAFLFILSNESQSSEYAIKEIGFANKFANKRVILIRFNDDGMTKDFFFHYQNADIIDWRVPEQKAKLFRDLRKWSEQLEQTEENVASPSPAAPAEDEKTEFGYKTARDMYNVIINEILEYHKRGQPVIVSTNSDEVSEVLSRMLMPKRIVHNVLTSKLPLSVAEELLARAGLLGAVTIVTNMVGCFSNIKPGPGVMEIGGLHLISYASNA